MLRRVSVAMCIAVCAVTTATAQQPYRLGYLVDATGPMQGTFKTTLDGFRLFIDKLNKEGGVNGRPIEVQVRDIQSDTQRSVNAVQELAAAKVSGIFGLGVSSTHAAVYATADKLGLPVVAGFPANLPLALPPANANAFATGLVFNITGEVGGILSRRLSPNGKTLVCVGFEVPGSILACDAATKSAKAQGFTRVETFLVPQNQRDFRSLADKATALSPDVITDCFGRGHVVSFLPALAATGYDGIYLNMDSGIGADALREGAKDAPDVKLYSYSRFVSGTDGTGPQVDALRTTAKQAGIPEILAFHSAGWVLGQVAANALGRCPGDCTPAELTTALEAVDVDTGGLTGRRVTFSKTDHYGASAYRLYRFEHATKAFVPVGDWLEVTSTPTFVKK